MLEYIAAALLAGFTLGDIPTTPDRLVDAGFGLAAEVFIKEADTGLIITVCDVEGCKLLTQGKKF